jgi:purine phosphoribosyltransferase
MSNVTAFDDGASNAQAAGAQMPGMQNSDAQAPGVHASSERADGAQMPGAQASEAQEASTQAADRENLTWQGFGDACRQIAEQIADSGWMPDLIVAIARGGMLLAGAISYALGVKANGAINVEFYTGVGKTMTEPEILEPYMDISSLEGKRVLIVDDVADSGKTLKLIMDLISEKGLSMGGDSAKLNARSATIYLKPTSIIKPDYVFKQTDKWINFPWSVLPPVTA